MLVVIVITLCAFIINKQMYNELLKWSTVLTLFKEHNQQSKYMQYTTKHEIKQSKQVHISKKLIIVKNK